MVYGLFLCLRLELLVSFDTLNKNEAVEFNKNYK
jgi:hypothetical protein